MTQGCPCRRCGPADGLLLIVYSDLQRIEPQCLGHYDDDGEVMGVMNQRHKRELRRTWNEMMFIRCRLPHPSSCPTVPRVLSCLGFLGHAPCKDRHAERSRSRDMPGCSRSQSSVRAQCRQIKGSLHLDVPSRYLNFSRGKDFQSRQVRYILLLDHVLAYSYSIRLPRSNRA